MTIQNGIKIFGFFEGMIYGASFCTDKFDQYRDFRNTLSKQDVIHYIENLPAAYTSARAVDIFTGIELGNGGIYEDGEYVFPVDFLHYYKNYDIGIPPEYEQYLKNTGKFN